MIYIEMTRDPVHGGGGWAFPRCLWAPVEKRNGHSWPYWHKVFQVRDGDLVFHLQGVRPNASFVGYSVASGDGFVTHDRPPEPAQWDYAQRFYRANLKDFTPLHHPLNLKKIFSHHRAELEGYYERNSMRDRGSKNIFFVRQGGNLQCLNGAYLSEMDNELFHIIFGQEAPIGAVREGLPLIPVETGSQLAHAWSRIGQAEFRKQLAQLYSHQCCFPECRVTDSRFMIAAHIDRWADNEELRGDLANGLFLCLVHDKAFEIGLFTLDEQYRVHVNAREQELQQSHTQQILAQHGQTIRLAYVLPALDALRAHRERVGIRL